MAKQKKRKPVGRKPTRQKSKTVARKVTRRKRKTVHPTFDATQLLDIEQVYKAINKVQLTREPIVFAVSVNDSAVVENILRDVGIKYSRKEHSTNVLYGLVPPPEPLYDEAFEDLDEYPDEIVEDGQVF